MTDQAYRIAAVLVVAAPGAGDTLERQTVDYELVDPTIGRFRGHVLSLSPARTLVEFAEVEDALAAGLEIQRGMAERHTKDGARDGASPGAGEPIELRLGLDLGELLERQGQLQGVATAERLARLARPGGVALSGSAFRHLRAKAFAAELTPRGIDQPRPTDAPIEVIDAWPVTRPGAQSAWIAKRHWTVLAGVAAVVMLLIATLVLWRPVVAFLLGPAGDALRVERPVEERAGAPD